MTRDQLASRLLSDVREHLAAGNTLDDLQGMVMELLDILAEKLTQERPK